MVTKLKFVIIFEYLLTIVYAIQNHLHTKKRTDLPRALFYNFQGTFSSLKVPFTGVSGLHSSICRVSKLKVNHFSSRRTVACYCLQLQCVTAAILRIFNSNIGHLALEEAMENHKIKQNVRNLRGSIQNEIERKRVSAH